MTRASKNNASRDAQQQQQQPDCDLEKIKQALSGKGQLGISDLGAALIAVLDMLKEMKGNQEKCLDALQNKVNVLEEKVGTQGDPTTTLAHRVQDRPE